MHAGRTFLQDLALALCVAAITAVLFQRLRQPVVLGFLLAGIIVGPHISIPLFVDQERIQTLSELGVILVMFSVGLEFTVGRLVKTLPTAGLTGIVQMSTMMSLGFLAARALGWTSAESLFTGAMLSVSSTMIVARVFAEQSVKGPLVDLVLGVLVVQDLVAVLLLALLTAAASGAGLPMHALAATAGRLGAFLLAMVVLGFLVVPRAIRAVAALQSEETLLVASIGTCFAFSLIALKAGYSVALGAFLAGSLVAESGEGHRIERLVRPVRDVFAALFFVSVGMIVDPKILVSNWHAVLLLSAVVVVGQTVSVSLGGFLSGNGVRTSVRAGMSLGQIGEFSFIIAALGASTHATRGHLYPVAVAVSVVTAFTTPMLIRASNGFALALDRRLPHPLQTFVSLYASWLDGMRSRKVNTPGSALRRLMRLLLLDVLILTTLLLVVPWKLPILLTFAARHGASAAIARVVVIVLAVLFATPFVRGVLRCARAIGALLAQTALPEASERAVDLAAAPRRLLVVTLQLAVVLAVALPLTALTAPFLPRGVGAAGLSVAILALGVPFWRRATELHEHVRAGAQLVIEALAQQSGEASHENVDAVQPLLPGLGDLSALELGPHSHAVGKTLASLDLRGMTGATVIAITRGGEGTVPTGREALQEGDVLALAGGHEAIAAARKLLSEGVV